MPPAEVTTEPSGSPIRASCASAPRCVWNSLPGVEHDRVQPALGVGQLYPVAGRERTRPGLVVGLGWGHRVPLGPVAGGSGLQQPGQVGRAEHTHHIRRRRRRGSSAPGGPAPRGSPRPRPGHRQGSAGIQRTGDRVHRHPGAPFHRYGGGRLLVDQADDPAGRVGDRHRCPRVAGLGRPGGPPRTAGCRSSPATTGRASWRRSTSGSRDAMRPCRMPTVAPCHRVHAIRPPKIALSGEVTARVGQQDRDEDDQNRQRAPDPAGDLGAGVAVAGDAPDQRPAAPGHRPAAGPAAR